MKNNIIKFLAINLHKKSQPQSTMRKGPNWKKNSLQTHKQAISTKLVRQVKVIRPSKEDMKLPLFPESMAAKWKDDSSEQLLV